MSALSILSVVGARPQFVKTAIVSESLARLTDATHRIVHTGQHFDLNMSDVFFQELDIPAPAFNLGISSGPHGQMTGQMLEQLEALYIAEKPDVVIVYGDTNSTLAGALAAAKLHIPLAHVEAGLRSFNRMPEEINRVLTDHVTDVHFSVTDASTQNLANEGITGEHVHQVGDVMYDCALKCAEIAERTSDAIARFGLQAGQFGLCTVHRAVNTDSEENLRNLIEGLSLVATTLPILLPVHPRAKQRMADWGISPSTDALQLVEPIGYIDMVQLERSAGIIVTDSGGVQREAFFHEVPCVTFREETEWTESVDLGWNVLVDLDDPTKFRDTVLSRIGVRGKNDKPYGDGRTGNHIARILQNLDKTTFQR